MADSGIAATGGGAPVRFATWGRWCGAGPVRVRLEDAEHDLPHCARCDRRVVGIDCDGWAFTLQRGPHRNDYGRWVTGLWLGRDVISRRGERVRF